MKKILIVLAFILLLAGLASVLYLNHKKTESSSNQAENTSKEDGNSVGKLDGYDIITYQGKKYQKNPDIKTLLFLGIDNVAEEQDSVDVSNIGRADTIIVFLINDSEKSIAFLPISRDTITTVDVYDKKDNYVSSGKEQINMQYSYGNTMEHGSILMTNRVTDFLYSTPISNYLSLTMDGIAKIVDRLGGITLTFNQDYTEINSDYQQGVTRTLSGAEAEAFIRYRDTSVAGSNNSRMKRANWLIKELFSQFNSGDARDQLLSLVEEELDNKSEDVDDTYLKTNISTDYIKRMTSYSLSDDVYEIQGENKVENNHDAFYADDEKLQKLLIELFYQPVK